MLFVPFKYVLTKFIAGRADCIFLFILVLFICSDLSARPSMLFSPKTKVIAIDDFHPVFINRLKANGIELCYMPDFKMTSDAGVLAEYDVIAVRSKVFFDARLIKSLPNLKCIARGGAGMDNIDEAYAISNGIVLLNAPEGNRNAVAEHTIGLLLNLSKHISKSYNEVRNFVWKREENRGWEIGSKTVGIIGFGNAGSALAEKLSGFGCKVLGYDKYKPIQSAYAVSSSLEDLLKQSHIISFHIPLSEGTRHFLNAGMIETMMDGVVIINTSRGGICKTEDILSGIKSGKIKAFAADVLENEHMQSLTQKEKTLLDQLMLSNQVIITPHIAGWSHESYYLIGEVLAQKIIEYTTNVKNIRMKVD